MGDGAAASRICSLPWAARSTAGLPEQMQCQANSPFLVPLVLAASVSPRGEVWAQPPLRSARPSTALSNVGWEVLRGRLQK